MTSFTIRRRDGFETLIEEELSVATGSAGATDTDVSDTSLDASPARSEDSNVSGDSKSMAGKEPLWRRRLRCAKQTAAVLEKRKNQDQPLKKPILRACSLQAVHEEKEELIDTTPKPTPLRNIGRLPKTRVSTTTTAARTMAGSVPGNTEAEQLDRHRVTSFTDIARRWDHESKDVDSVSFLEDGTVITDYSMASSGTEDTRRKPITLKILDEINNMFEFVATEACTACGPQRRGRRTRRRRSY